jgi:cell fate regulator YaaT (PSP1 superfamily)
METINVENKRQIYVKLCRAGKLIPFDPGNLSLKNDDPVVVETERGVTIGTVVDTPKAEICEYHDKITRVIRVATDEDYRQIERNREKEKNAYDICVKKIKEMNLPMKMIKTEFSLGGGKASFFFSADGRVDFRELVKSLAQELHTKIEMVQIGVRDEAKLSGGLGICGKEFCCSQFLRDFAPVSIKMAKVQNLALNPQKVSGGCGRLLCCLAYEYMTYENLGRDLPKLGKRVSTATGDGRVKFVDIFRRRVQLEYEDGTEETVDLEEIDGYKGNAPDEK